MNRNSLPILTRIIGLVLGVLLGSATICHAAIKPRINPKALAEWQRDVGREVWKKLKTIKSLSRDDIDGIIDDYQPLPKKLFQNFAAATQQVPREEAPEIHWPNKAQEKIGEDAFSVFIDAQNLKDQKKLEKSCNKFMDQFFKLDGQSKLIFLKLLQKYIDGELEHIGSKARPCLVPHCKRFGDAIRSYLKTKFSSALTTFEQTIRKANRLEQEFIKQLEEQKINSLETLESDVEKKKSELISTLYSLTTAWNQSKQEYFISIITDPEFEIRLNLPGNEDFAAEWRKLNSNQSFASVFWAYTDLCQKQSSLEKIYARWFKLNREVEKRAKWLEQDPLYKALNNFSDTCDKIAESLSKKVKSIASQEQQKTTSSEEDPVAKKSTTTIAIPSMKYMDPVEEEFMQQSAGLYEGFTWTNPDKEAPITKTTTEVQ
ncbi:MAG: hypothetical protein WC365_04115 [Candidatus Babeliales bacterium]|jgi:hypothetical protein